ncbi:MAG: tyrosine-type recombinase/integrase [Gammaproteobacteria bacterium]
MGALTDTQLRHWVRARRPLAKADGDGLTFTLSAKGTAAWTLRYYFGGKRRELTLGRYPEISLSAAPELANAARGKVSQGVDVARDKQAVKHTQAAAMTLETLAEDYLRKRTPQLAARTAAARRQHIETLILPALGKLPARDVTPADVVQIVEAVGERSIAMANFIAIALREVYKHGMARRVVDTSPVAGISVSAIAGTRKAKSRIMFNQEELAALLRALPSVGLRNATAIQLLLLTCVRVGELARARWEHVDFDKGLWRIPDEHSKNRRGFVVPLTAPAVTCFRKLEMLACGSAVVLPSRVAHDKPFNQGTLNFALARACTGAGIRKVTAHDLRSTARSYLGALGVNVIVAERCLNHSLGGLLAVYDQHDYIDERRVALERWAVLLDAIEQGQEWNVTPMRKAVV